MDYNNGKIIGEVEKNSAQKYIVAAKEYKGYKFVDVRMYYKHEDRWLQTKKGITIT